MTVRFVRGRGVAVVVAALVVAVAGCDSSVTGSPTAGPNPHRFAAKQAFGAAADDLEQRPIIRYITSTSGSGSAKLEVRISRTGATYATGTVDGDKLTIAAMAGKQFVETSQQRWRLVGAESGEAKKLANRLTLADPYVLGFDPARSLTPKEVVSALRQAFREHQESDGETSTSPAPSSSASPSTSASQPKLEREVERIKQPDGTEVYRIPLGPNYVEVTATKPYRVVATDLPLTTGDSISLLPEDTRISFAPGDENTLRKLYGSLRNALPKIKSSTVYVPGFRLSERGGDLNCAVGGNCTAEVKVSNTYQPRAELPVSKFEVTMKVTMRATGLGSRSCTDTATMRANKSQTMSCSADFALAPSYTPQSYPVRATWTLTSVAKYTPDTKKLRAALSKELAALIEEI